MEFSELMMRKAREGVKVRVIYDDVGSWNIRKPFINMMRDAGVQIFPFLRFVSPASQARSTTGTTGKYWWLTGRLVLWAG